MSNYVSRSRAGSATMYFRKIRTKTFLYNYFHNYFHGLKFYKYIIEGKRRLTTLINYSQPLTSTVLFSVNKYWGSNLIDKNDENTDIYEKTSNVPLYYTCIHPTGVGIFCYAARRVTPRTCNKNEHDSQTV